MRDKPVRKMRKSDPKLDSVSRDYISPLEGTSEDYWDKHRKNLWAAVIGQAISDCSGGTIREFSGVTIPNGGIYCDEWNKDQAHYVLTNHHEYLAEFVGLDPEPLKKLAEKTYQESTYTVRQQRKEVSVPSLEEING